MAKKKSVCEVCGREASTMKSHERQACATCRHILTSVTQRPEVVARVYQEKVGKPIGGDHAADELGDLLTGLLKAADFPGETPAEKLALAPEYLRGLEEANYFHQAAWFATEDALNHLISSMGGGGEKFTKPRQVVDYVLGELASVMAALDKALENNRALNEQQRQCQGCVDQAAMVEKLRSNLDWADKVNDGLRDGMDKLKQDNAGAVKAVEELERLRREVAILRLEKTELSEAIANGPDLRVDDMERLYDVLYLLRGLVMGKADTGLGAHHVEALEGLVGTSRIGVAA